MQTRYENVMLNFDRIYLINLDRRADRLEQAREELTRMEAGHFQRVSGVVHSNPATGCHLSHAKIFRDAIENGYENVLILEDDVEFFPGAFHNLELAYKELPLDWQMFYLGANLDKYPAYKISEHICKITGAYATHAYAVNRSLFNKLLEINENVEIAHNDVYYADFIHPNYNCYLAMPIIAGQRDSFSDIQGCMMSSNSMFVERLKRNLVE